jgi:hypothetical protein
MFQQLHVRQRESHNTVPSSTLVQSGLECSSTFDIRTIFSPVQERLSSMQERLSSMQVNQGCKEVNTYFQMY